jgi:acid phosphatase type 7
MQMNLLAALSQKTRVLGQWVSRRRNLSLALISLVIVCIFWGLIRTLAIAQPAPVIAAAGDIVCANNRSDEAVGSSCRMKATSDVLVGTQLAAVLPLGDLQYGGGTLAQYQQFYAPTWGRLKAISRPAIGNHEYDTPEAKGYFDYFGAVAGERTKGYYSYDIGNWHLIALNANCRNVGGCNVGSPQEKWLKADLAQHLNTCTLAYWHQPRFSSGFHGGNDATEAFWQDLYDANADVILNGHDHLYERFMPQTPAGKVDHKRGIREFVVGTGGKSLYPFRFDSPNTEVRNNDTYGVLLLTLRADRYDWKFAPEPGGSFTDSGRAQCH